jgi:hypothetical protein
VRFIDQDNDTGLVAGSCTAALYLGGPGFKSRPESALSLPSVP